MTVLYLTEKIIAYFRESKTEPLRLVAVKNSDQTSGILPMVDMGELVSVSYDRKEKVYRAYTTNKEYIWDANDLTIHKEAFQERFILNDNQPLYVLVKHIQQDELKLLEESCPGVRYVMMQITKESKYGDYEAIYHLPNKMAIYPFAEKLVERMIEKEPDSDEADVRYDIRHGDLNAIVEIDMDIAERMFPF